MHPIGQIFSATEFVGNFLTIVRQLGRAPQHLLVTHKSGKRFVFVNAELFDELLDYRLSEGGTTGGANTRSLNGVRQGVVIRMVFEANIRGRSIIDGDGRRWKAD